MSYVVTDACIDVQDRSCVDECPVDCIYEGETMMYIQPDECVDCGRCEPVCPVISIFHHEDLPAEKGIFAAINSEVFDSLGSPGGARKVDLPITDHARVTAREFDV